MNDIIYEHTKRTFLQLKEQVDMLKKENKMLRDIMNNKEDKPKIANELKTVNDYNPLDFCKEFQKLYKEVNNIGLYIHNYGSAAASMKKIMDAFYGEKETNKDILVFLKWGASRKTHTGHDMNIGYLSTLIQTYRVDRAKILVEQEPAEIPDVDEEKLKQIIAKRSK